MSELQCREKNKEYINVKNETHYVEGETYSIVISIHSNSTTTSTITFPHTFIYFQKRNLLSGVSLLYFSSRTVSFYDFRLIFVSAWHRVSLFLIDNIYTCTTLPLKDSALNTERKIDSVVSFLFVCLSLSICLFHV